VSPQYVAGRGTVSSEARPALAAAETTAARGCYSDTGHLECRKRRDQQDERSFHHPKKIFNREIVPLWLALAGYAWHARHHTAQIELVKKHKLSVPGWSVRINGCLPEGVVPA